MKKISIIFNFINGGDEPFNTIDSIYETANKDDFEIIVIDDNEIVNPKSDTFTNPELFKKYKEVKYIKTEKRLGVGATRDIGIKESSCEYILIIDCHMRFLNDNWLNKIVDELKKDDKLILCTPSIQLFDDTKDGWNSNENPYNRYTVKYGADLNLVKYENGYYELFSNKWKEEKEDKKIYEIPSVLGACYGVSKKWIEHIKGFNELTYWGSSEAFISLKTWLAGGSVKILTNTSIAHVYKKIGDQPYQLEEKYILYNKLWILFTLFKDEIIYKFINLLQKDGFYNDVLQELNYNLKKLKSDKKYYENIFTRDHNFLIEKDIINLEFLTSSGEFNFELNELKIKKEKVEVLLKEYRKQLNSLDSEHINDKKKEYRRIKLSTKVIPDLELSLNQYNTEIKICIENIEHGK